MLKIRVLGSGGAVNYGKLYTSLLIDDKVLVEPSPTCLYSLKTAGIATRELEYILISHYHADHFFGLPLVLLDMHVFKPPKKLYIIGPYKVDARVRDIIELAFPRLSEPILDNLNPVFLSLTESPIRAGNMELHFKLGNHVIESYSFLIDYKGKKIFYSGDTLLTDEIFLLIEKADIAFVDMNDVQSRDGKHMNLDDLLELKRFRPELQIVAIHTKYLPRELRTKLRESDIDYAVDNQIFTV